MSTPKSRGRALCIQLTTLNFGIMLSYWINYGFNSIETPQKWHWRVPVALQLTFILTLLLLVGSIPESPRYLTCHGHEDAAKVVLSRLVDRRIEDPLVLTTFVEIQESVKQEVLHGRGHWYEIWQPGRAQTRRRFLLACGIQAAQQLGGVNALICKLP